MKEAKNEASNLFSLLDLPSWKLIKKEDEIDFSQCDTQTR